MESETETGSEKEQTCHAERLKIGTAFTSGKTGLDSGPHGSMQAGSDGSGNWRPTPFSKPARCSQLKKPALKDCDSRLRPALCRNVCSRFCAFPEASEGQTDTAILR